MERGQQPWVGMSVAGFIVLFLILASLGALVVFSLALAHVLAGWGIFFFYTVPALAMLAWAWHEVSPSTWRRAIWPFLRLRRTVARRGRRRETQRAVGAVSRPAVRPGEPGLLAPVQAVQPSEPVAVIVEGTIAPWLVVMRTFLAASRSPRGRRRRDRRIRCGGRRDLRPGREALRFDRLAARRRRSRASGCRGLPLFVLAYPLKAFGWRLFRPHERPQSHTLAAALGAAAVTGAALPGRFDDVVRIAVVRRLADPHPGVGTLVLTLFLLGLLDATALSPFAAIAAVTSSASLWVRVALGVVAAAGVCSAVLIAVFPASLRAGAWVVTGSDAGSAGMHPLRSATCGTRSPLSWRRGSSEPLASPSC